MIHSKYNCYFASVLFIGLWWGTAFYQTHFATTLNNPTSSEQLSPLPSHLSQLNRHEIHQALNGNTAMMISLIAAWDVDAQFLETELPGIKRLPPEKLQKAHRIARHLENNHPSSSLKFLPQTYVAASILMAIAKPEQIVAIPSGMRTITQLYPENVMRTISLDSNRYNHEEIYEAKPDIGFIAHYSFPATVTALKSQGVDLYELNEISTPDEIRSTIEKIGQYTNLAEKAALLSIFMESALDNMDNRLTAIQTNKKTPSILYLNKFTLFATPSQHSLTGQILKRIGIHTFPVDSSKQFWSIPLDQEQIAMLAPEMIIISSPNADQVSHEIESNPAFQTIPAIKSGNIHIVEDEAQQSPSQYLVLAYYDLYVILAEETRR